MSVTFNEIVQAECLQKIRVKYNQFLESLNEPQLPQVQIFEPLDKTALEQIELVREVSRHLQKKKEEEQKAAEAKNVNAVQEETKTPAAAVNHEP